MRTVLRLTLLLLAIAPRLSAQKPDEGTVTGAVSDPAGRPVEFVTVTLKEAASGNPVRTAVTDSRGHFSLESVPFGTYRVTYSNLASDTQDAPGLTLDAQHRAPDLGNLKLNQKIVAMDAVQVSGTQAAFYNSIDRKVYNVGKDIQSSSGSASELLQNIPSVDVDIEGNVSLRGDANVLILIDGKTSTSMGPNRAAVLEQMPADAIERIEVITNPSAKYKPDGTAGIINITLKKKHDAGYAGSIRLNVGNNWRGNAGISGNYNPGRYNLYGSYNLRQDDRLRTTEDNRQHFDTASGTFLGTRQHLVEHMRPLTHVAQAGIDYKLGDDDKIGFSTTFNRRTFFRASDQSEQSLDTNGAVLAAYDRMRTDPEFQQDTSYKLAYRHDFAGDGHELDVELKRGDTKEKEDNHYTNLYRAPAKAPTYDITRIMPHDVDNELSIDYARPFASGAKIEAGYDFDTDKVDTDHFGSSFDATSNSWITDTAVTNRFIYKPVVQALYGTLGRPLGAFGFLAGLRVEHSRIGTDQVTAGIKNTNAYTRVYPTLHLSYNLGENHELQWNYSHRVQRPDGEDLNPYPEFQDPFNLRAGNPNLKPEEIHSVEAGYQYKKEDTSFLATLYYRYRYNGITDVTRYIDATTLLTTKENLAKNTSGGLELAATASPTAKASLNFSSNIFYNVIDAGNLGYGSRKSTVAWSAKLSASLHPSKTTLVQVNGNYNARRLTPQGYRLPTFVANVGLKHELADKKTALVLTVSDLFDSMRDRTRIDTPILREDIVRRRSARIVYAGMIYNFGGTSKKAKDESLQFDNQP